MYIEVLFLEQGKMPICTHVLAHSCTHANSCLRYKYMCSHTSTCILILQSWRHTGRRKPLCRALPRGYSRMRSPALRAWQQCACTCGGLLVACLCVCLCVHVCMPGVLDMLPSHSATENPRFTVWNPQRTCCPSYGSWLHRREAP